MGAGQSSQNKAAGVSSVGKTEIPADDAFFTQARNQKEGKSKVIDTPIIGVEDIADEKGGFPTPTGHEYDLMDKIAAALPNIIDSESRQQVDDYRQACDGGKGPMVACFATAEYLSLFERKHQLASDLYRNTCFRPKTDKDLAMVLEKRF